MVISGRDGQEREYETPHGETARESKRETEAE